MAGYYKYSANMNDRTYFTSVVTTTAGDIKRYFSNVESEIYFGDKEMDDIYQFQFSIDEKVLPIYGYNGYHASELVSGQRLIQGQFIVNYTNGQEIKATLGEIDSSVNESILADAYHPGGGSMADPIYNKLFDIMIGYGYYNVKDKQTYNATCQTLIGCKINGMQKVIDSTGQPIMEVYSFFAMDFIEENVIEAETSSSSNSNNKNNKGKKETPLAYVCSDFYNSVEKSKHSKLVSQYKDCNHFIHSLTYDNDKITLTLKEESGKTVKIKEGTLEISDKLDENVVIPVFSFGSTSGNTATITLDRKYVDIINRERKDGLEIIQCKLHYIVTVIEKDTKDKQYNIAYENGKLYLMLEQI